MTTIESPMVRKLWELIHENNPHAGFGGSVPYPVSAELLHSYHRSWDDSPHDDGYTVHFKGDRTPGWWKPRQIRQYSCALDVGFSEPADMMKYTARLHHLSVTHDAAHEFGLREFAGTLDGKEVYAYDCTIHERTYGWDGSHMWHNHLSFNRRWVNDKRILRIAEIYKP